MLLYPDYNCEGSSVIKYFKSITLRAYFLGTLDGLPVLGLFSKSFTL